MAGVDDDLDGTTDEQDEALPLRPTTVNNGYGSPGPNAYQAGVDASPGLAGVDDDGNGTTDDVGEIGQGGDDGDDGQRIWRYMFMDGNVLTSSLIWLNLDPLAGGGANLASIRHLVNLSESLVAGSNEIADGFYQPETHYNFAFCKSGTCYGSILWVEHDQSNPAETVGPVISTDHTSPDARIVGFVYNSGADVLLRQGRIAVNQNFSHKLWAVSGNRTTHYPSPSADLDNDRDVDGTDFLTFSNCFNGALNPPSPVCPSTAAALNADLDGDDDVDGTDFLTFSNCFNGALNRPSGLCFPAGLDTLTTCP